MRGELGDASARRPLCRSPPEDYEFVAHTIARWWDASGRKMPDTDNSDRNHPGIDDLWLTKLKLV